MFSIIFEMKFVAVLFTYLFYVKCNNLLHANSYTLEKNETVIPTEIVSNILYKYLGHERVFLSFVSMDSSDGHSYLQNNLINNLVAHPKLSNFSYNILKGVDQIRQGNTNIFNVVIVDGSASLS